MNEEADIVAGEAPAAERPKWTTDDLLKHFTQLHSQIGEMLAVRVPDAAGAEVITGHQVNALQVLEAGGTTMRDFAQALNLTSGSATSLADRLVRSGLAERSLSPSDRRIVRLKLTADGQAVIDDYTAKQRAVIQALGQRFDGEKLIPVSDCALELLSLIASDPEVLEEVDAANSAAS